MARTRRPARTVALTSAMPSAGWHTRTDISWIGAPGVFGARLTTAAYAPGTQCTRSCPTGRRPKHFHQRGGQHLGCPAGRRQLPGCRQPGPDTGLGRPGRHRVAGARCGRHGRSRSGGRQGRDPGTADADEPARDRTCGASGPVRAACAGRRRGTGRLPRPDRTGARCPERGSDRAGPDVVRVPTRPPPRSSVHRLTGHRRNERLPRPDLVGIIADHRAVYEIPCTPGIVDLVDSVASGPSECSAIRHSESPGCTVTEACGPAATGSAAVGSAAVGSAAVDSAATGSAAVGGGSG